MKNKINSAQYGNEPFSPKWPGVPYAEDELLPPFQCRTMKKATLASLYFPDDSVEAAKQHLRRWMAYCKPLTEELRGMGYNPSLHSFMKREVEVIIKHLGEP